MRVREGLRGKRDGHRYHAFVVHNRLGAEPNTGMRWETHFVFESGIDMGRLLVAPASLDHAITRAFGTTDIRVESAAFNETFHVTADDREKARDIARGPMKEYMGAAAALIKQFAWVFPALKAL